MDMANEPAQGITDEVLIGRFAAGDRSALGELAVRYEVMLLGLCRGLLGGRSDVAMDAVQETWVRVIRSATGGAGFEGRSSFRTWVYRIAVNQCRTLAERGARAARGRAMDNGSAAAARPHDEGSGGRGDVTAAVRDAVAAMPEAKREVLLLCYHAGLTHEQAAEVMGIPLGTLKSRLHAALNELRGTLAPEVVR